MRHRGKRPAQHRPAPEPAPHDLAVGRQPRTDRHVCTGRQRGTQSLLLIDRRGSIGVREQDPLTVCRLHARAHCSALALVRGWRINCNAGQSRHVVRQCVQQVVRAAIINDNDFIASFRSARRDRADCLEVRRQASGLVVRGQYERQDNRVHDRWGSGCQIRRAWVVFVLWSFVIAAAAAMRVPRLGLRPMHADEAVQAARFRDLWLDGDYRYDPTEFHGPTLIYATLPSVMASGAATFAETSEAMYRAVPVAFGVGLLLLFWLLRDALGRVGMWWAATAGGLFARVRVLQPILHSRDFAGVLHSGHHRGSPGGTCAAADGPGAWRPACRSA